MFKTMSQACVAYVLNDSPKLALHRDFKCLTIEFMKKPPSKSHLSVIPGGKREDVAPLTRGEVAERLGISISTVRRFEAQERLHPKVGDDGVHRFDVAEVAALALELVDDPRSRLRQRNADRAPDAVKLTPGEEAAQVFERFEQRHTLAEIVIGVRVTPDRVRDLFRQWTHGLVEHELHMSRKLTLPLEKDNVRISVAALAARLGELPKETTRISVARYRGPYNGPSYEEDVVEEFAWVRELGGFLVHGPCELTEITRRYGEGDYRITAYGFDPPGLRWEVVVEGVHASK